jgi:predicted nucleic acid-binding protein
MAIQTVVFDASAVVSYVKAQPGGEKVKACLLDSYSRALMHRQNAAEVWYQMHRQGALSRFLTANPQRIAPDGRPDLTGLDMSDGAVFDAEAGRIFADSTLARVEATGVQIVGDETFPDLWKRAGEIKSQFRRVSLADCFGVALAVEVSAPFWTSDRHELTALQSAGAADIVFIR